MSKLTPFGVALRKLRIEKELRLFDLAEKMGKSTALLSAIETGRKPIPDMFITELKRALDLTKAQTDELRSGKEKTREEVNVSHLAGDQREVVAAFARRLDEMPPDLLEQVRKTVLKSVANEVPFKRKRHGILVPPMSRTAIETLANKVRSVFCDESVIRIPIIDIIEFQIERIEKRFDFQVRSSSEMGDDEGRVIPGKHLLILREDVYEGACVGEARARFTACHELGHYVMHHEISFARMRSDEDPVYRDAEWQADTFAGCLMMPRNKAPQFHDANEAAAACGMSSHAASVMLSKYMS